MSNDDANDEGFALDVTSFRYEDLYDMGGNHV
jgi:hypothetical protein